MTGRNWYVLGLVLLVLGLVDTAVLTYPNSSFYGVLVSIWGAVCFVLGAHADSKS